MHLFLAFQPVEIPQPAGGGGGGTPSSSNNNTTTTLSVTKQYEDYNKAITAVQGQIEKIKTNAAKVVQQDGEIGGRTTSTANTEGQNLQSSFNNNNDELTGATTAQMTTAHSQIASIVKKEQYKLPQMPNPDGKTYAQNTLEQSLKNFETNVNLSKCVAYANAHFFGAKSIYDVKVKGFDGASQLKDTTLKLAKEGDINVLLARVPGVASNQAMNVRVEFSYVSDTNFYMTTITWNPGTQTSYYSYFSSDNTVVSVSSNQNNSQSGSTDQNTTPTYDYSALYSDNGIDFYLSAYFDYSFTPSQRKDGETDQQYQDRIKQEMNNYSAQKQAEGNVIGKNCYNEIKDFIPNNASTNAIYQGFTTVDYNMGTLTAAQKAKLRETFPDFYAYCDKLEEQWQMQLVAFRCMSIMNLFPFGENFSPNAKPNVSATLSSPNTDIKTFLNGKNAYKFGSINQSNIMNSPVSGVAQSIYQYIMPTVKITGLVVNSIEIPASKILCGFDGTIIEGYSIQITNPTDSQSVIRIYNTQNINANTIVNYNTEIILDMAIDITTFQPVGDYSLTMKRWNTCKSETEYLYTEYLYIDSNNNIMWTQNMSIGENSANVMFYSDMTNYYAITDNSSFTSNGYTMVETTDTTAFNDCINAAKASMPTYNFENFTTDANKFSIKDNFSENQEVYKMIIQAIGPKQWSTPPPSGGGTTALPNGSENPPSPAQGE